MRAALALALAVVVGTACGRKGQPLPPELVVPSPPGRLVARATPEGIMLSWTRPDRYTSGRTMKDLGQFVIERAPADAEPAKWTKRTTITLDDRLRFQKQRTFEWLDRDVVAGAGYQYRVTSVTIDRDRSTPAGPVTARFGSASAPPSD